MISSIGLLFNGFLYMQVLNIDYYYVPDGVNAIILVFCPLPGFLADVKFSRFRVILTSAILSVIMIILAQSLVLPNVYCFNETCSNGRLVVLFWIGIGLSSFFGIFLIIGFIGFIANAIQFGIGSNFFGLLSHFRYLVITLTFVVPLLLAVLLVVALCFAHHQRKWFIIDIKRVNPYKLVLKVTKFAYQHKIPVRRNAFTYCEDDLPSGLDLGKNKYGGPFTTKPSMEFSKYSKVMEQYFYFSSQWEI